MRICSQATGTLQDDRKLAGGDSNGGLTWRSSSDGGRTARTGWEGATRLSGHLNGGGSPRRASVVANRTSTVRRQCSASPAGAGSSTAGEQESMSARARMSWEQGRGKRCEFDWVLTTGGGTKSWSEFKTMAGGSGARRGGDVPVVDCRRGPARWVRIAEEMLVVE